MSWRCVWWGLVVCVCASNARAQEDTQEDTRLSTSVESALDAIRGGLDGVQSSLTSHFSVGMADNWQSGLAYSFFSCPHGSFPSRENVGVRVSYDDSRLWETSLPGFKGMQPSASMGLEAVDKAVWVQLGIRPEYELRLAGDHPLVASLPVTVGLGSEYDQIARSSNPGFGYLDIGVAVSTPLFARSARGGSWGLTAGVNFLFLGEGREALNGGDDFEVLASITLGFEF